MKVFRLLAIAALALQGYFIFVYAFRYASSHGPQEFQHTFESFWPAQLGLTGTYLVLLTVTIIFTSVLVFRLYYKDSLRLKAILVFESILALFFILGLI